MFGINNLNYIEKNGYSQKSAYSFQTKIFDLEYNIPKNTKMSDHHYNPNSHHLPSEYSRKSHPRQYAMPNSN